MPEEQLPPRGFRFSAVEAGIRKQGGADLILIASDAPASAAGMFTSNRACAAPVTLSAKHLRQSRGRAWMIVANAGNANCATPNAMKVAEATAAAAAKLAAVKPAKVLGFAKGSGMIHPKMTAPHATMLAFIVTDARIAPPALQKITSDAVSRTFNCISVDGDTSTNDTVFVLANGAAGNVPEARIAKAIEEVMLDLAKAIASDGEGARRLVRIEVTGARDALEADTVARAIGNS